MKNYEVQLISVINDFADEYSMEELFDELFPGMSVGELVLEMYNAGIIPDDALETFLEDE
jgi:hypothetical protein